MKRGQLGGNLVNSAIGIGLFVFVLAIFSVFLGESQSAIDTWYCSNADGIYMWNITHNNSWTCCLNTSTSSSVADVGNCTAGNITATSLTNSTYQEGQAAMETGSRFGSVLVVLVILLLAMAAFTKFR